MENLLDIHDPAIREILRNVSSDTTIKALYTESDKLKTLFLKNCSKRAREGLVVDMKNAAHSSSEIHQAQSELLTIASEQLSLREQRLWDELMPVLPPEPLPDGDIELIYSLDIPTTKQWMDKAPIRQQFQILMDDDASYQFWEKKMKPNISEKAIKIIEEDWILHEAQFEWEVLIARSLITRYIQNQSQDS